MKRRGRCKRCRYGPLGSNVLGVDPARIQLLRKMCGDKYPVSRVPGPSNDSVRCCTFLSSDVVRPFAASVLFRGRAKYRLGFEPIIRRENPLKRGNVALLAGSRTFNANSTTDYTYPCDFTHTFSSPAAVCSLVKGYPSQIKRTTKLSPQSETG